MVRFLLLLLIAAWVIGPGVATPAGTVRGQRVEAPAWSATASSAGEQALLADAADGRLDQHTLVQAALVAGGITDPIQCRRYEQRLAGWISTLHGSARPSGSARQRAEQVFQFMHENVLRGQYREPCTGLEEVFERGDYNCVSSAILYDVLASACGLRVAAVEVPGHVRCRVRLEQGALDIETTCPNWHHACRAVASDEGRLVSPDDRSPGLRELSPAGLVALVYYNRGIDALERRQFALAAEFNAKSLRLDPASATARNNLLATLNNWSLDLAGQGRRVEALELLERGVDLAPDYEVFRINYAVLRDSGRGAPADNRVLVEERSFDRRQTAN